YVLDNVNWTSQKVTFTIQTLMENVVENVTEGENVIIDMDGIMNNFNAALEITVDVDANDKVVVTAPATLPTFNY
ncbi:MAG: hypothetical protein J6I42_14640, partial [Clostridia bacterium]|nr:hypothetical protein [Clostridia bacterium]